MKDIERVIDILGRTSDGRSLYQTAEEIQRHGPNGDGQWLAFLQDACNDSLNQLGSEFLAHFHECVLSGTHLRPFKEMFAEWKQSRVSEPVLV